MFMRLRVVVHKTRKPALNPAPGIFGADAEPFSFVLRHSIDAGDFFRDRGVRLRKI